MEMIPTPNNANELTRFVVGIFVFVMNFIVTLSVN
jgi:hypothetical protein